MSKLKHCEAIIIKCVKFKESSIIAHLFTSNDGIVPVLVSGVRSINNKGKAAQFQLGQVLDVVYYDREKEGVMRLKESAINYHFVSIPFQIQKIALTQYFLEITRNCIYQTAISSGDIYPLLKNTLIHLDQLKGIQVNLAIYYLWNLIHGLGLAPYLDDIRGEYLDLQSGEFCVQIPSHQSILTSAMARKLKELLEAEFTDLELLHIDGRERKTLLESGHQYLNYHLSYFRLPKSADIFREILRW